MANFFEKFRNPLGVSKNEAKPIGESEALKKENEKLKPFYVMQVINIKPHSTGIVEGGWTVMAFNKDLNKVVLQKSQAKGQPLAELATIEELLKWNPEFQNQQ